MLSLARLRGPNALTVRLHLQCGLGGDLVHTGPLDPQKPDDCRLLYRSRRHWGRSRPDRCPSGGVRASYLRSGLFKPLIRDVSGAPKLSATIGRAQQNREERNGKPKRYNSHSHVMNIEKGASSYSSYRLVWFRYNGPHTPCARLNCKRPNSSILSMRTYGTERRKCFPPSRQRV